MIIHNDTLLALKDMESDSIDMIFTSPPYANQRKSTYGGIKELEYIEWFLPIATEFKRVLKPSGSFFLNIKPHTKNGERVLYVMKLVIALKEEIGFRFVDEFSWNKHPFPGAYKGRFKNAFEPIYHFSITKDFTHNPLACGTPMKPESIARTYRKQSGKPKNGSGMTGMNTTNIRNLKLARPSNVILANNVSNQYGAKQYHPATFPEKLVEFFVKSFSNEGDLILDPFAGSGTTGVVCEKYHRRYILIDKVKEYIDLMYSQDLS